MMRSMSSAVSSLRNHQTRMDVIGNNIANVNTVAFKSGRVTFKDAFSENLRTGTGPSENRGGLNPHQVGLGMSLNSIDNAMRKGSIETTGIGTDIYIDGEGWLQVSSSDGVYYTRDGNLSIDKEGNIVTQSGHFVQGYQVDDEGKVLETTGKIRVPIDDVLEPKPTSEIELEGNLDSRAGDGLLKPDGTGGIDFPKAGAKLEEIYDRIPATGDVNVRYELKSQYRGDGKKQRSLLGKVVELHAYDSLGKDVHRMELHFVAAEGRNSNKWNVYAFYNDDVKGKVPASPGNGKPNALGTGGAGFVGTVEFDSQGRLKSGGAGGGTAGGTAGGGTTAPLDKIEFTLDARSITGANEVKFNVDLSKITQLEAGSTVKEVKNNGYPLGELQDYAITGDGKVLGIFTNGRTKLLGQIVTATFANDNGLQKAGDNLWSPTENSGKAVIGKPGDGGSGMLQSGALEMSNVDLAKEFTSMIITQRGFQANSRVISTTDQMLEELVNLKR